MAKTEDRVIREGAQLSKYKIRILETAKGNVLDVREYVDTDTFQGFTRKGIRLDAGQANALAQYIRAVVEEGVL